MASASDRVYSLIRGNVVEGRYRPNQRLVELDLADELNASRTPIRQALQRLELEGLVQPSRHGWIIRDHSLDDIMKIYEVRIALEGQASRLACARSTGAELEAMQQALDRSTAAIADEDKRAFIKHHDAFHAAIVKASHNVVLEDAVRMYREHPYNRRVAHVYSTDDLRVAADSHARMLGAISSGRADDAEQLTREHLELSKAVTVQRFGSLP